MLAAVVLPLHATAPRSILPPHGLAGVDEHASDNVHSQRYARHRRLDTLSDANTDPIRLDLDFSPLYETTAPEYSACFTVGAWFRRGLPDGGNSPPADGVATCVRGADGERLTCSNIACPCAPLTRRCRFPLCSNIACSCARRVANGIARVLGKVRHRGPDHVRRLRIEPSPQRTFSTGRQPRPARSASS
jgi:hypothetical protein